MFPLVSIITVCRNAVGTINKTISSVTSQTYSNIEYIIIDGASTDGTVDIIRACSSVSAWISEPDSGIVEAFNKGLALAHGEWIGILNADDWYEPEAVATIVKEAEEADIIHGAVRFWASAQTREVYYPCQNKLLREMTINHPSVFIRRSVYEKEGGFAPEYRLAMDYELLLRLYTKKYRFKQLTNSVLTNMSYGGVSDKMWIETFREAAEAKKQHGVTSSLATSYFFWQITRGWLRRICERHGLNRVVQLVRKYISPMRKA